MDPKHISSITLPGGYSAKGLETTQVSSTVRAVDEEDIFSATACQGTNPLTTLQPCVLLMRTLQDRPRRSTCP